MIPAASCHEMGRLPRKTHTIPRIARSSATTPVSQEYIPDTPDGQYKATDEDDPIVERPDPQGASCEELPVTNFAEPVSFCRQKSRDQEPAQDITNPHHSSPMR